ncbi:MAG: ABC transporter ATP-binding protein [Candidatus Micrarchaeia archaeon]
MSTQRCAPRALGKPIIRLSGVTKDYYLDETVVHALRGIDLVVREHEFVSIMGKSGSGKSTLLHLIGLLDTPTSGKIFIDNIDATRMSEDERADFRGRKIGFVFQFFHLLPTLTAWENAALPLVFQGVDNATRKQRAEAALARVGLAEQLHRLPSQLSGGERQRVAIARALVTNPSILLCDEPTGNLDTKTGHDIMEILCELNARDGKTIICVTHDMDIAEHSKRIVYLKDGVVEKSEVLKR